MSNKYRFNGNVYKTNGRNGYALKNLVLDVVKQYVQLHPNNTYADFQNIFSSFDQGNKRTIFNENDFISWKSNNDNSTPRYFDPFMHKNEKIYVLNQWGDGERGNLRWFIEFVRSDFGYSIETISQDNNNVLQTNNAIENALQKFINSLEINNENLLGVGLKLSTSGRKKIFYVYKNNNNTIFTKPIDGQNQFSQAKELIKNALEGKEIRSDQDKSYIEPIAAYIIENYLKDSVRKEDLLQVMMDFQNNIHPGYVEPKKHFFKIAGQDMEYPRKYIVLQARTAKNLDNTNYTTDQAKRVLDSCFSPYITHINKDEKMQILLPKDNTTLNTILYGPPGTGKTYSTTQKALEIIDDQVSENHAEAKKRFSVLQKNGQIQMVTFHQSYGYEEFVEGLSADTVNGQVSYSIKEGLFKKIVQEAKSLTNEIAENMEFDELYERYLEKLSYLEDGKSNKVLKTVRGIEFELFRNSSSVVVRANNNTSISISKNALLQTIASSKAPYYISYIPVVLEDLLNGNSITVKESSKEKKYVLIIDEINRGNISKIFGELITLVESSKRLGADDETKIILPYSKEEFSIPSNLYIIGTMNTADRSIAVLDTALRRRFNFEEMMPNVKLLKENIGVIEGIDVGRMLERINKRIEVLYDRDHMIGHAYLLDIKTLKDLQEVMENKIIPLLQEYFYDDWQKINLIFNNNEFIQENEIERGLFPDMDDFDFDEEQKVYTLNTDALSNLEMYKAI